MSVRCHCFTLWSEQFEVPNGAGLVRGVVAQKEICPKTKRLHWQGYAEFSDKMRGKKACETLGLTWPKKGSKDGTVHFSVSNGTRAQNTQYCLSTRYCREHHCGDFMLEEGERVPNDEFCDCSKAQDKGATGEHVIYGTWPTVKDGAKHGQKGGPPNCYKEMMADVKAGMTLTQIKRKHPDTFVRYHGGVEKVASAFSTAKTWKPWVCWLSGPAGQGKSRCAMGLGDSVFFKSSGNKWFDGYEGQQVAVLDDFRKHWFAYDFLLKLLDHGECKVEVKGGMVQWRPKIVVITCHKHWMDLYRYKDDEGEHEREDIAQLTRRIDYNVEFPVDDWRRIRWRIRQALVYGDHDSDSDDNWRPDPETLPPFYKRPKYDKKNREWALAIADREGEQRREEEEVSPTIPLPPLPF